MKKPSPECRVVARRLPNGLADVFLLDPRTGREAKVFVNVPLSEVDETVLKAKRQLLAAGDRVSFTEV